MKIPKQNKKAFTITLITVLALVLIGGGVAAYVVSQNQDKADSQETNSVNYDPPTDQEIEEGQDAKKDAYENSKNEADDDKSTTNKRSVSVGVSFADIYNSNLEVRAFTNGIVEAGTCTITVTKGSETITKTSGAFIDASSTQCEPVFIPKSELETGAWSVTVKYSSASAEGISEKVEVTVR